MITESAYGTSMLLLNQGRHGDLAHQQLTDDHRRRERDCQRFDPAYHALSAHGGRLAHLYRERLHRRRFGRGLRSGGAHHLRAGSGLAHAHRRLQRRRKLQPQRKRGNRADRGHGACRGCSELLHAGRLRDRHHHPRLGPVGCPDALGKQHLHRHGQPCRLRAAQWPGSAGLACHCDPRSWADRLGDAAPELGHGQVGKSSGRTMAAGVRRPQPCLPHRDSASAAEKEAAADADGRACLCGHGRHCRSLRLRRRPRFEDGA